MAAHRSVLLGLILSVAAWGQAAPLPPTPSDLLEHARAHLMSDVTRQARYACVQNITRHIYDSDSKARQRCGDIIARSTSRKRGSQLISTDRLQLDVAIAHNREIHSWPGAPRFAEQEIRELVGNGGPFGSGDFAAFIVGVFRGSATVRFEKPRTVNGHAAFEYSFAVSRPIRWRRFQRLNSGSFFA